MGNALRALVLLACSCSAEVAVLHNGPIEAGPGHDSAEWLVFLAIVVPFVMAVIVAWRGHDR